MKKKPISENPAVELSEQANKFGLHCPQTDALIRSILVRPDNKERIKSFERFTGKKIEKHLDSGFPFHVPTDEDDIAGDLIIGKELYTGRPTGVYLTELTRPAAVFGATGFYKTITMLNMAVQLINKNIPLIIIDRKGRQFRCLQQAFPERVLVMQTNSEFPYNPYSITSPDYQTRIVELRSAIFGRKDSTSIFLEVLESESKNYAVCEHDLHNAILSMRFKRGFSNMKKLQQSLLAISTGIVSGSFGRTLAYTKGIDLREVMKKKISIVIESPDSSLLQLEFLVSALINECQYHLRNQDLEIDKLQIVFMIDEGSEIFRAREGIPPVIELATKIRQSGIGLVTGMHAPHLVHPMFLANLYMAWIYRVGSGSSAFTLKKSYSLSDEVAEYIPKQPLSQGFAILGDRYAKPLGFQSLNPVIEMDLNIPDDSRKENNKKIMSGLPEIVPWKGRLLFVIVPRESVFGDVNEEMPEQVMNNKERRFLDYVLYRFDIPVTEVYKELGLSMEEGNRVSNAAVKKNLATEVRLNPTGRKGGLSRFLVHTEKYFVETNIERPISGTDGKGAEHCLMIRFILRNLKAEKQCKEIHVSKSFHGAVCDVFFRHNDAAYVIEVCSSTAKTEAGKLMRIFRESDISSAFIVVKDKDNLEKVSREFQNHEFKDKITLCRLSDFLNTGLDDLLSKTREV